MVKLVALNALIDSNTLIVSKNYNFCGRPLYIHIISSK
jgi:hypothetical protein